MKERTINFPIGVPYGTTHFEHGRTFEYVEPGMWKSIGGSGGGSGGGSVEWADVLNKPQEIKNLSGETPAKVSFVSGGSY